MTAAQRSGLVFIFLCIGFTVTGQLLGKHGIGQVGKAPGEVKHLVSFLIKGFLNPWVFSGVSCAGLAAICWMAAVSRCELSFAYPFMSLAIVLVLALSPTIFGEQVSAKQWLGVGFVCLGLWVSSRPN